MNSPNQDIQYGLKEVRAAIELLEKGHQVDVQANVVEALKTLTSQIELYGVLIEQLASHEAP